MALRLEPITWFVWEAAEELFVGRSTSEDAGGDAIRSEADHLVHTHIRPGEWIVRYALNPVTQHPDC